MGMGNSHAFTERLQVAVQKEELEGHMEIEAQNQIAGPGEDIDKAVQPV